MAQGTAEKISGCLSRGERETAVRVLKVRGWVVRRSRELSPRIDNRV
jgi:hypothetical protein